MLGVALSSVMMLGMIFVAKHLMAPAASDLKERCKAMKNPAAKFEEGMRGNSSVCEELAPQEASAGIPWRIR